jgi:hypothetical protein
VLVHCRDLAVMAATLANGGVTPLTGERALGGDHVENVLSVMGSSGMYDATGEWISQVGTPAKSGVAGGILAVLCGLLEPHVLALGDTLVAAGSGDRSLFFILRGSADVWIEPPGAPRLRVASLSAGTALGEMALLDASPSCATSPSSSPAACARPTSRSPPPTPTEPSR